MPARTFVLEDETARLFERAVARKHDGRHGFLSAEANAALRAHAEVLLAGVPA